jgi:hypothetical protein
MIEGELQYQKYWVLTRAKIEFRRSRLKRSGKRETLKPHMKLRLAGAENRLNIERRILMALRFIYFKTSEPQNFEG